MWEFPGGKLKEDESIPAGIERELAEELHLRTIQTGEVLCRICREGIEVHFIEVTVTGEPALFEHQAVRWCAVSELKSIPLCPADEVFVNEKLLDT